MSTPTLDYGEPWKNATYRDGGILSRHGQPVLHAFELAKRAVTCTNALAGVQDPAAHLANLNDTIEQWETELSAALPPDFKDWFQNDKSEWPLVARRVIESLHESDAEAWEQLRLASAELVDVKTEKQALNATIAICEDTIKTMNDALKEAHRIFGNLSHSQVVQRLCPDFKEIAELVRKSHDQHA